MIKVNEIPFIAYPSTDKSRSREFYEGAFGLKLASNGDFPDGFFWFEYEIGTQTLALSNFWKPAGDGSKQTGPSLAFEVDDYDGALKALKDRGVTFTTESMETAICHLAVISDPDGNSIFIHKRKPGHN